MMSYSRQSGAQLSGTELSGWQKEAVKLWEERRLAGEDQVKAVSSQPPVMYTLVHADSEAVNGCVVVSNYRFFFHGMSRPFHTSSFYVLSEAGRQDAPSVGVDVDLPLGCVAEVRKASWPDQKLVGFELVAKDFRPTLRFQAHEPVKKGKPGSTGTASLVPLLNALVFCDLKDVFAFKSRERPADASPAEGWHVYQPYVEFDRLGVREAESGWKVTELNKDYQLVDTYPFLFAVPAETSDEQLRRVASYRSKGRLPLLSWLHPQHRAALVRCSQPQSGLRRKRCTEDEEMFRHFCGANRGSLKKSVMGSVNSLASLGGEESDVQSIIFDARPKINAQANVATGGGTEVTRGYKGAKYRYLDIGNIHVMRNSLSSLHELVYTGAESASWLRLLEKTEWLLHMHRVLEGARRIALQLERQRRSVLLHCSDGWDRTAQLSSLVMLMLDPFYRTLEGFPVLIEKEWLALGHKFADRTSQGRHGEDSDEEASPIFLQFMDAAWQLTQQFPQAFEFNSAYLVEIVDAVHSCRFGTFLFNCERERREARVRELTPSVWAFLKATGADGRWTNVLYCRPDPAASPVVLPRTEVAALALWGDYYTRWIGTPREQAERSFLRRLRRFVAEQRQAARRFVEGRHGDRAVLVEAEGKEMTVLVTPEVTI